MAEKQTHYLRQLRDQVATSFGEEDLRELVFDLGLDWDELQGARKTARVQDLIVQLGRSGRLSELVDLLREKRPYLAWPNPPSIEQQRQDILTAFPPQPFYQQLWFWGVVTTVLISLGLLFVSGLSQHVASLFSPPLFPSEAEGETLIVIATFRRTEGVTDVNIHGEIQRAIQDKLDELGVENVRVEIEPTAVDARGRETAEALGKRYSASMIIWGADTGVRLVVNFLNLKQPDFYAAEVTLDKTENNQMSRFKDPDAYTQFIVEDLPNQISFLALFAVGQSFAIQESYEPAITVMQEAINLVSDFDDLPREFAIDVAYFDLGWLYQVTGQVVQAIANYDQAISLNPQLADAAYNRGNAYVSLGKYETAIASYDQVIALNPQDALAFNNRGVAYAYLGQYETAIADYDQAIALNPQLAETYYSRGLAYAHLGQHEIALANYEQAVDLNPQLVDVFYNRGLAYAHLGQYETAIADFDQAIALNPQLAEAFSNRGLAYAHLGEYETSIADYNQAIALNPQLSDAFTNRGVAYTNLGQYETAIANFDQAIALNPQLAEAFYSRGTAYGFLGQYETAIANFDQAIAINPQNADAFTNRGIAYANLGQYETAIANFDQAIAINPQLADAFINRELAYAHLGQYETAIANYNQAIVLNPQHALAFYNRGLAYHALERYAEPSVSI